MQYEIGVFICLINIILNYDEKVNLFIYFQFRTKSASYIIIPDQKILDFFLKFRKLIT